ncbi:MAG: nucleotide triphosphate diphosphatase NUDT15 [Candidatus Saccharimonadales bacterium]
MASQQVIRVGIGVFVFKDGKFILGRRQGSHGRGDWATHGGHLEFGETFEQAAKREVLEETGLKIKNVRFGAITNDYFEKDKKHYVTVWVISDWVKGKERIKEPDKFIEQGWYDFNSLPSPLFAPWKQFLHSKFIGDIKKELAMANKR